VRLRHSAGARHGEPPRSPDLKKETPPVVTPVALVFLEPRPARRRKFKVMFSGNTSARTGAQLLSNLPKGVPPGIITAIEDAAHRAFNSHGLSAFEMSREAAIAHECGHTIVMTAEGAVVQSVSIFSRSVPLFKDAWGGWCQDDGQEWTTGPDSSAESDLSRARIIVAGLAGEAFIRRDKPGSSLDELALSQAIGFIAAQKLADLNLSDAAYADFAEQLWHKRVWGVTGAILLANRDPFMQLANHLHQSEKINGGKLRAMLAGIKRITP
jgi:hypothetical protein